MRGIINCRK